MKNLNKVIENRKATKKLLELFINDSSNDNIPFASIFNDDSKFRLVEAIASKGKDIRLMFFTWESSKHFDTWKGVEEVNGIERKDVSDLRKLKIVKSGTHFDDGTLHITIDRDAAIKLILNTVSDEVVDSFIEDKQSMIDSAVSIIDKLESTF